MLMVVESLGQSGSAHQLEFDNLLLIIHYYALRAAMKTLTGLGKKYENLTSHDWLPNLKHDYSYC